MSRTQPTNNKPKNPAEKFLDWDSEKCEWKYYDKTLEKNMSLPMGSKFIVLDQLNTIKGYDEERETGIWSNEVRSVADTLNVMAGKNKLMSGTWKEVKASDIPAKFTNSVYAMMLIDKAYVLVNFQLRGASLRPWFDFVESHGGFNELAKGDNVISVTETEEKKKGRVVYNSPVYEVVATELSEAASKRGDELDKVLQSYLKEYLKPTEAVLTEDDYTKVESEPEKHNSVMLTDDHDDIPF